jgi:hypothetical protein
MNISIYGLGAIGSNLMVQLFRQHPDYSFIGVDFDKVEERNLATQMYYLEHIGYNKVVALKGTLNRFNRVVNMQGINKKVESDTDIISISNKSNLIIDCFDNSESRRLFNNIKDTPILHVGFSPFYTAEIMWHGIYDVPGAVDPNAPDICEMDQAVPFINFVVSLSSMVADNFLKSGEMKSFIITNKYTIRGL